MMAHTRSNIVLIGMPGSGKSTVGVILAKLTSLNFVDTDILIQVSQGQFLQDIVDTEGHMALREVEEKELLTLNVQNHVIATGGSAVYSHSAIKHLKSDGMVVFVNVDLSKLEWSICVFDSRGGAKRPDQSVADLFDERFSLYTKYADVTIDCLDATPEGVCARIIKELKLEKLSRS
ncbi:MAG: shikimate kinase [Nitrospinales bacterium]